MSFVEQVLAPQAPAAVVSVTEGGLIPASVASRLLGTPGVPLEVVEATRNKLRMRQLLAERAPHLSIDFADAGDEEGLERLCAAHADVIAKPVFGTASEGVYHLRSFADRHLLPQDQQYLCEAFVAGVEYSVEAFSRGGVHQIVGIAEKGINSNFIEVSHLTPPASLDEAAVARVHQAVVELLDALAICDGPTHTELKVSDTAIAVIETHNRLGGDGIADLVEATTGIDWRRASVGWPLGIAAVPAAQPIRASAAATLFFTAPAGRVVHIAPEPVAPPGVTIDFWKVNVAVGDVIGPVRSSADRLGVTGLTGRTVRACHDFMAGLPHDGVVLTEAVPT